MCRIIPYDPTVKDLFEEAELSQREAAAKLGVSPALVNQLLNRGTLPKTGWAGLKKGLASLLEERGAQAVIPPNPTRKHPHAYNKRAYRARNLIERMFCRLKDFRRVATRYDKLARNFISGALIAATVVWWCN